MRMVKATMQVKILPNQMHHANFEMYKHRRVDIQHSVVSPMPPTQENTVLKNNRSKRPTPLKPLAVKALFASDSKTKHLKITRPMKTPKVGILRQTQKV